MLVHQSLDCFVVLVICSCTDNRYFVAQFDYCVCDVRLLSWLVSSFLAGFMGNS